MSSHGLVSQVEASSHFTGAVLSFLSKLYAERENSCRPRPNAGNRSAGFPVSRQRRRLNVSCSQHLEKLRGDNCIKKPYLSFVALTNDSSLLTQYNLLFYLLYLLYQGTDATHFQPWGPMKYLSKFSPLFRMQYLFIPHSFLSIFFLKKITTTTGFLLRSLCSSVIRVSKWL